MDLSEFASLFEECVEAPLRPVGFERYKKSKTLIFTEGVTQVALIRLGGRLSRPGCVVQVLCFRHTFLRPIGPDEPVAFTSEPNDYPFKLSLQQFVGPNKDRSIYKPMNLGNWPMDSYRFETEDPNTVRRDLQFLKKLLAEEVVPWALGMTPKIVASQIRLHGEEAWCENRWLEDYEAYLAASPE